MLKLAGGALAIAACILLSGPWTDAGAQGLVFPDDPAVINAQTELGAKGDGVTDDTEVLQRGLDESCGIDSRESKVLYLPDGVYRVTKTLVVRSAIGPWVYGQSRDGTIIRLDDGLQDCTCVLRTHPREQDPGSADWFMRNIRNLTIDVGRNPETDGIRYFATNTGILRHVRVVGHGKIGINAGFMQQSGPNLIQDVEIDGFAKGVLSQWIWGQTLSRITIRNCREVGLEVCANSVAVEDLVVENTPLAVLNTYPNDWTWWGGVVALVGGRFSGGNAEGPAVRNTSVLYARDVQTTGFGSALASTTPGGDVSGPDIAEYSSHEARRLFEAPSPAPRLAIQSEPRMLWETDPRRWVCASDYGAAPGDNQDDTEAVQRAIDAAAAAGATTLYFRGISGPDPNWYNVGGSVRVHGSVRHILGLGFGRILGGAGGAFVVGHDAAPIVRFENIDSFGGPPVDILAQGATQTVVVDSCGVNVVGDGAADIFMTNCPARIDLRRAGQRLWARHLNPEGTDDVGLVRNAGADLWIMGMKCEGKGIRIRTSDGGRTEVYGTFIYGPGDIAEDDERPLFDVDNASLRVMGIREISFGERTYAAKVRERQGDETRLQRAGQEHGWIGWPLFLSGGVGVR
jgi:hypothetical protein